MCRKYSQLLKILYYIIEHRSTFQAYTLNRPASYTDFFTLINYPDNTNKTPLKLALNARRLPKQKEPATKKKFIHRKESIQKKNENKKVN